MSFPRFVRLTLVCLLAFGAGHALVAQSAPQAPSAGHKHYVADAEQAQQPSPTGQLAPRLQNLGTYAFPVNTKNPKAQLFVNQGLNLSYAFNHAESGRAFREAARLDPKLAMAYWGQALVLGPNINAAMEPTDEGPAYAAIQKAVSLKPSATVKERALIDALAQRYTGKPEDRVARDRAYSAAMRKVHQAYPADNDIAILFVESLMDLRPWGYWMRDGQPYEGVTEAVSLVERVIARSPKHPGALHLYIHLMEAFHPKKAEAASDRLLPLLPAAGHMVHMPSHIYQRVGRYADAIKSNQLAIAADEDYITQCRAQGLYPIGYYPHNLHFLWFAATFDGQSKVAIEAARKTASKVDPEVLKQLPLLAAFKVVPYYALIRFGRLDEMLAEPAPSGGHAVPARHVPLRARDGVRAQEPAGPGGEGARDRPPGAEGQVARLAALLAQHGGRGARHCARRCWPARSPPRGSSSTSQSRTSIAPCDWRMRSSTPSRRRRCIRHGICWVRCSSQAGRAAEAETIYWEDLKRFPDNGWALVGVVQALRAQGKNDQATVVQARLDKAWARADVKLTGSRFGR